MLAHPRVAQKATALWVALRNPWIGQHTSKAVNDKGYYVTIGWPVTGGGLVSLSSDQTAACVGVARGSGVCAWGSLFSFFNSGASASAEKSPSGDTTQELFRQLREYENELPKDYFKKRGELMSDFLADLNSDLPENSEANSERI